MPGWARRVGVAAAGIASTALVAAGLLSGPDGEPATQVTVEPVVDASAAAPLATAPLAAIAPPAIPFGVGSVATQTGHQVVVLAVRGGSLSVSPTSSLLRLRRIAGTDRFSGAFGPVVVTDARGTLAGWTLSAEPGASTPSRAVQVRPHSLVAVTGRPGEARASAPTTATEGRPAALMAAGSGGGGGMFGISGTLTVTDSATSENEMVLHIDFAVH